MAVWLADFKSAMPKLLDYKSRRARLRFSVNLKPVIIAIAFFMPDLSISFTSTIALLLPFSLGIFRGEGLYKFIFSHTQVI